jgi:hypothetical protein
MDLKMNTQIMIAFLPPPPPPPQAGTSYLPTAYFFLTPPSMPK